MDAIAKVMDSIQQLQECQKKSCPSEYAASMKRAQQTFDDMTAAMKKYKNDPAKMKAAVQAIASVAADSDTTRALQSCNVKSCPTQVVYNLNASSDLLLETCKAKSDKLKRITDPTERATRAKDAKEVCALADRASRIMRVKNPKTISSDELLARLRAGSKEFIKQ